MKKMICVGLAIMLLALCAVPAFAADVVGEVQISTQSEEAAYEISIPADTVIPWEAPEQVLGNVAATKLQLEPGYVVRVTVASENGYNLVNDADATKAIGYTLVGADAMVFQPGAIDTVYPLSVTVSAGQWAQAAAGRHADVLTFTAEYAAA